MIGPLFSKGDYDNLSFPIHTADPKKSLLAQFPSMASRMPSVVGCEDDRMVKYVILMYDRESPLIRRFNDLAKRKETAAVLSGFDLTDEEDAATIAAMGDFIDNLFNAMATEFIESQHNLKLSMLHSNEQTFYEYQKILMTEVAMMRNDKDRLGAASIKSKLMEDSDLIAERIEKYFKAIYQEDKIIDYAKKRSYSPETVAKQ